MPIEIRKKIYPELLKKGTTFFGFPLSTFSLGFHIIPSSEGRKMASLYAYLEEDLKGIFSIMPAPRVL